jgi:hypothetical protein
MALACDLRIAVPGAAFFYPVMKLGFLPQPSDPARLAALVGPARARLMLMGGARIGARRRWPSGWSMPWCRGRADGGRFARALAEARGRRARGRPCPPRPSGSCARLRRHRRSGSASRRR